MASSRRGPDSPPGPQRERDRADAELRESEHLYRQFFDDNPHMMWVYDPHTFAFLAVNRAAVDQYGYSPDEFLALRLVDLYPEHERAALLLRQPWNIPQYRGLARHQTKDGRLLDVEIRARDADWRGRPARLALIDDLTERKRLEDQLRHAYKMEAIGQLAGGVAHDFNNLLTVILGYSELLTKQNEPDQPLGRDLREITAAAQRAATLTRQLLAFSRKQALTITTLDISHVVRNVEAMMRRVIGEQIVMKTILADEVWPIRADASQLEQILMNLVVNARDAMPLGGVMTIQTANADLDGHDTVAHSDTTIGSYAMMSVTDTGSGMPPEIQCRIFEPFFTTKDVGQGTGLGLAAVYGIVKQLEGHIEVESAPDRGTTFRIYLPKTDQVLPLAPPSRTDISSTAGTETILLVEDHGDVREFTKIVLQRFGYQVIEADSAEAALAFLGMNTPIHLLLTDVVLPGLDGRELAARVTKERPHVRVLYMSGYTGRVNTSKGGVGPAAPLLEKPFTAQALLERTRQVLGPASGTQARI